MWTRKTRGEYIWWPTFGGSVLSICVYMSQFFCLFFLSILLFLWWRLWSLSLGTAKWWDSFIQTAALGSHAAVFQKHPEAGDWSVRSKQVVICAPIDVIFQVICLFLRYLFYRCLTYLQYDGTKSILFVLHPAQSLEVILWNWVNNFWKNKNHLNPSEWRESRHLYSSEPQ